MLLDQHGKPLRSSRPQSTEHAFDAAKRLGYRGYFYFPTLDPKEQMEQFTRDEIARKINWLYNNVGAVTLVIDGIALDEVDTGIWPRASTSDPQFNQEVTNAFDDECGEARVFDEAGVENYYTAQMLLRRHIRAYGDHFGQHLLPGQGSSAPSINFIPMWQVRNARTPLDQSRWRDGVMTTPAGRAIKYRCVTNKDGSQWIDVSADEMYHYHDHFWTGQRRGVSGLAPVAKKLFTIDDITRAEANGVLLRSRLAYALTTKEDYGAGPQLLPGAQEVEEVETSDGRKMFVQKVRATTGDEIDVATLPPGVDIKVLESQRALPVMEFNKTLLTDVAYCTLYPPEYTFFMGGVGQGTLVRAVQNRVRKVRNKVRHFQIIPQFCKRWYLFWLYQRIKAGRFTSVPKDWFRVKHICPADDTVDQGREGKLYDSRLETGKMSPSVYHGMNGEDAEDVDEDVITTRIRRERRLLKERESNPDIADQLTYDRVFVPPAGRSVATVAQPLAKDKEDNDNPDDDDE